MLVMEHVRKTPKLRIREDKPEDNEDESSQIIHHWTMETNSMRREQPLYATFL